jgi:hypothetical protein
MNTTTTVRDAVAGISTGISEDADGFTALTLTESKTFKTRGGAERWLAARGYTANGARVGK